MKDCLFRETCKNVDTDRCTPLCYPYVFLSGSCGKGGWWGSRNVPKKYDHCRLNNLKLSKEHKEVEESIHRYVDKSIELVLSKGVGIYLFGTTGTGKTTTAITVLNEYLIKRARLHLKKEVLITDITSYFVRLADFQNTFNSQFRGTVDMQELAAQKYYTYKENIKRAELLVIDDIALRDTTESFRNEIYEVIDHRISNRGATIFTSNVPLSELHIFVGERVASRIDGMSVPIELKGTDFRKGGMF